MTKTPPAAPGDSSNTEQMTDEALQGRLPEARQCQAEAAASLKGSGVVLERRECAKAGRRGLAVCQELKSLDCSEEHFRLLAESAGDGIICVDAAGQIVYWNKAAEAMFGYSSQQMIGKPLTVIMPLRIREAYQRGMSRMVSAGDSSRLGKTSEVVGLRADGSEFPIEISLEAFRSADGLFFAGILRDVTARKRAEAQIESLSRFPSENPFPVMRFAADGTLLYANAAARPLLSALGCEEGGVLSGEPGKMNQQALQSGSIPGVLVPQGRKVFSFVIVPISSSGYVNWYGCDVTKAWAAEAALQKAKDLLEIQVRQRAADLRNKEQSLAEAQRIAHLGNWDWNIRTNELLWSDEVYRIFRLSPQEVITTYDAFLERVHPDDRRQVEEAVNRALTRPGIDYSIDHRVVRPDGSERIVHERGEVMFGADGKPLRMIGTVHDVTDRKLLEREVLQAGTAEQRRIGRQLHDGLGQELTGLSYFAKSLHQKLQARGLPEADAAAELAAAIPQIVGQLHAIIKGISPLETDARNLVPALQMLAASVEERTGVRCRFQDRTGLPLKDDQAAVQLYLIAQEAVNHAVRHGKAQHVSLTLTCEDHQNRLEVRDDGVGPGPGAALTSGAGLRIMRYRAGVIGGTVEIAPAAAGGTLVTCILPRERHDDPESRRQPE